MINKQLIILLFILTLVSNSFAQIFSSFRGEVNANNIHIRSDSTINSEVISKLNKGDYVDVVLELYDWYKIKLPKNAPAFIKKDLVGQNDRVLKDSVNIRLRPNDSSPIIGKVNTGEILNIIGEQKGWYKIVPVENSFGWIHKKFVNKVTAVEKQENTND